MTESPRDAESLTVRCYGGSMDYFFASGELVSVDTSVKNSPGVIRSGDIIAYLDWADAPLVSVHRVILPFRRAGRLFFLTKGDGNLWFDPPVSEDQLMGRVAGMSGAGGGAGLLAAGLNYLAALLNMSARAVVSAAQRSLCVAASAVSAFLPSARLLSAALSAVTSCDAARRSGLRPLFSGLAAAGSSPGAGEPPASSVSVLSGEVSGELQLSGRILVAGDVTVLPGARLRIEPGSEVSFSRAKYVNASAPRPAGIVPRDFSDGKLIKFLVYGEFSCGGAGAPVRMGQAGEEWDSIIFLGRSRGTVRNTEFTGRRRPLRGMDFSRLEIDSAAQAGSGVPALLLLSGFSSADLKNIALRGAEGPVSADDFSRLRASGCSFSGPGAAISAGGRSVCRVRGSSFSGFAAEACRSYGRARIVMSGCSSDKSGSFFSCSGGSSLCLRSCAVSASSGPGLLFYGRRLLLRGSSFSSGTRGVFFSGKKLLVSGGSFSGFSASALESVSGDAGLGGCSFSGNSGAAAVFSGDSLSIRSCGFSGNARGVVFSGRALDMLSSEFRGGAGPALSAVSGRADLKECSFEDNAAANAVLFSGRRLEAAGCAAFSNGGGFAVAGGDAAFSGTSFSRNSGAALTFSGGSLEAVSCAADGNGRGFVLSGRRARVADTAFSSNAGAALSSSRGKVEVLSCSAGGNGRGFLFSGGRALVSECAFSGNSEAALEADGACLSAGGSSFSGGAEALRAGRGARAELSRSRVENASSCAVTVSGPDAGIILDGVRIEGCRRGAQVSGGSLMASGSSVTGSAERGLFAEKSGSLRWTGGGISLCGAQAVRLESGASLLLRDARLSGNSDGISSEASSSALSGVIFEAIPGSALSLSGGSHQAADCGVEGCGSGLGVHGGAELLASRISISSVSGAAAEVSSSLLRAYGLTVSACAGGITAGAGGTLQAEGLRLDGASSHGVQLRGGVLEARNGSIRACGGCAVLVSAGGRAEIDSFEFSGCRDGLTVDGASASMKASVLSGMQGACISCSAGSIYADGLRLLGGSSGFSLHRGSSAFARAGAVEGMETGIEATGGSSLSFSGTVLDGCGRGAWLQEGAKAGLDRCQVRSCSTAGVYADSASFTAAGTLFSNNNIAVFSDNDSSAAMSGCEFSGNRTGIKADNRSAVSLSGSSLSGSEWDAVWCAGDAGLELEDNHFSESRYAIKEDGPCRVSSVRNTFSRCVEDRLAWPRD